MKINVKQIRASYRFDFFDNEWYCNHDNLQVIQPCCSGKEAEWCGCQGEPEFYCPNPDCDGIEDEVVNICAREESSLKENKENKQNKEKKMKKLNIETIKTIIITILITAIIAFVGGMYYQKHQTEQVKTEAATIVKNVKVEVSKQ